MGGIQDNKSGLCLKKKEARRGMREKIMKDGGGARGEAALERNAEETQSRHLICRLRRAARALRCEPVMIRRAPTAQPHLTWTALK